MRVRAWENDAVFSPMPNRPRSWAVRAAPGPRPAMVIAVTSSLSVMPRPSSLTATQESLPSQLKVTSTWRAPAAMLLSTRSATAASVL